MNYADIIVQLCFFHGIIIALGTFEKYVPQLSRLVPTQSVGTRIIN